MGKTVVAEQRLLAQINQRMEKAGNWNLINNLEEKKKIYPCSQTKLYTVKYINLYNNINYMNYMKSISSIDKSRNSGNCDRFVLVRNT